MASRSTTAATRSLALAAVAAAALAGSPFAGPAHAAGGTDPDWPCIQGKVPHLSLGQVWTGPAPDAGAEAIAASPEVQALAQRLALRRTPLPDAEAMITAYAEGKDATALTGLYLATFEHINRARDRIMGGIARYARKQVALDEEIKAKRHEFDRISTEEPGNFDAIDAAERDVDWSTRIFMDRQQSLTYVCETPVILEQRAFALGRAVAGHLP